MGEGDKGDGRWLGIGKWRGFGEVGVVQYSSYLLTIVHVLRVRGL